MSVPDKPAEEPRRLEKLAERGRRINRDPTLIGVLKRFREMLPGDSRFGDPMSVSGPDQSSMVGRRIAELAEERPGVLGEAGFSALQVWQALSEAQGRGKGERELAIVFTDLVEFSSWAMDAGDEQTLALLRDVSEAIEPPVRSEGGEVVKRLGDGMLAVFSEPESGLRATFDAMDRLRSVSAPGYEPRMRAGMHVGRPRRIGGDYLGVDVNVAARIAEAAAPDEVLASEQTLAELDPGTVEARRKRRFRAKGVPKEVAVYSLAATSR